VRSVGELLMQSELPHLAVALDPWRTHAAVQDPAFLTELWNRVTPPSPTEESPSPTPASLLQTATLLAATSPEDPRWVTLAPRVCELLVELPPDEIAGWRTLLYPARQAFLSHLVALCELPTSAPRERAFALESLSSWGRGNPSVLATALLNADPVAFRRLISIARLERSALIPKLLDELARPRPRELVWNDPFPPIDPAQLPADLVREITAAAGAIQPQSAYCLRLPLSRFQAITEQLAQFQFRPLMLASFVAVSPSQVSVIWIRDGQSAITRVGLTPESVLTLDQGFRSRGWQILGLAVDETRAFWSAVWGPPAPWNTGFTTPVPLIPRVDLCITPFPAQPWRVRFEGPAEEVSSAPGSDSRSPSRQPLWLGEYNSLGMAVRDFCDRFPKHTAGVRMTAQTSFSSPPGRFCCSTICLDPAASPQIDGQPLGEAHAPTIDQPFRRISWITLAGGSHTLSVTQDWTVVDRRAECQVGLPSVTVIGAPDHQTWYDRPIGLSDPEDLKTLRQPDFDVVKQVHSPIPEFSNSLARLFAEGYRPSYLRYSGSSTALDLCRPRPAFAQIDRDACRRVRAALALQWLAAPESGLVPPLLQILERRLPSGANDPDPTLQTELVQHLATYPLPNPAPWLALSPSRSVNLAPEAHRSLLLALCLAGRQMAPATRSLWLAQLDLPAQRSAHRDAGVHSALELLLATWEALDQRSPPGSRLVQAVDQVVPSTASPSAGDGLSSPPIPEPSVPLPPPPGERPLWWRAPHGLDFALIPSGQYRVGGLDHRSAAAERGDRSAALESPFAISLHRVPLSLLDQFLVQSKGRQSLRRPSSYPAEITWIEATEFFNWLSRREGLQPVYDIVAEKEVEIAPAALQRTGYRFPTEREWEIVARCHTRSEWLCGDSPTHLGEFGWVAQPVSTSLRPLGLKLPNPAGLFDLHGNGYELLHDGPETGSDATGATPALISPKTPRFVRGKPHYFDWNDQRLHQADVTSANSVHTFRLARTLQGLTHTTSQTANQDIPGQSLTNDPQP